MEHPPARDFTAPLLCQSSLSTLSEDQAIITISCDDQEQENTNSNDHQVQDPGNIYGFLRAEAISLPPVCPVDPFRNDTPDIDGLYEWLKIIMFLPIALIRLLLFGLSILVGYLATICALNGWKDRENPMPNWRRRIMWITRLSARCILFCFGYHWIKRVGHPAARNIAPIVVSNHVSYIEPIFFFYELFPAIVASESHDALPIVGAIIRAMQVIYVNRFSESSRKHALNEIKRKASCNTFPRVLLFPEGTTTNGRVLISFQLGAFVPGFSIQPVIVRYPHIFFDQSWGNISLAKLMFRMFTQFHNFMEVQYLPILFPLENRKETAYQFASRTSYTMASALNVAQTNHSYGDLMLLIRASQSGKENAPLYMVEMASVESAFGITTLEALDFLDRFLKMHPNSSGRVDIHGFARAMKLNGSTLVPQIFSFLDVDKIGTITFKQFLVGSASLLSGRCFLEACGTAFEGCDREKKGYITKIQLGNVFSAQNIDISEKNVSSKGLHSRKS